MFDPDLQDKLFFKKWQLQAISLVSAPVRDDWDWLAIAQHHGFPTRLLDWSYNPLAAAFFAVEQAGNGNAALFALRFQRVVADEYGDPFSSRWADGVRVYRPRGVVTRLVRQSGIFTVHDPPALALEDYLERRASRTSEFRLVKIIIDESYTDELRRDLQFLGIDRASLMGDLDALSSQMSWEMERIKAWGSPYLDVDLGLVPALQTMIELEPVDQLALFPDATEDTNFSGELDDSEEGTLSL